MIKAFLLDYDGVYTRGANNDWIFARLAENLDIPFETSSAWLQEIWATFLKGKMTEDEVWSFLEAKYGKPIDRSKRDIWFTWEELTPYPDMVKEVRKLKTAGYVVGVLSNIFANNKETIKARGGYNDFDVVVTSCDLGYKKPEPEIFEAVLKQLKGIEPNEVAFLDDREANAKASEAHDMKGIYVQSHQEAIKDIESLLSV
ncbi:MAG TPA: HAD family phosphatase [Verrucomicrobiae bacterium]|nr:HAD family phosphatase [Verrucomicrobiae bacterium]